MIAVGTAEERLACRRRLVEAIRSRHIDTEEVHAEIAEAISRPWWDAGYSNPLDVLMLACSDADVWDSISQIRQVIILQEEAPAFRPRLQPAIDAAPPKVHPEPMAQQRLSATDAIVFRHAATGAPYLMRIKPQVAQAGIDAILIELGYACALGPYVPSVDAYVLADVRPLDVREIELAVAYTEGKR